MAIIHPYADPSAHGKVTPGLMFKRRGPRVTFGAAPRPRDKKSAAQLLQRNKIREAVAKYKILNYEELIFLRIRGSMLSKNPYQLYISSQLKENDWSRTQGHQLNIINNMVIFDREQDDPNDMRFSLKSTNTKNIRDNIAVYTKLDSEVGGVITSEEGPNFDWEGPPDHDVLKFDDGAFSSAHTTLITTDDNGDFFEENFDQHMFSVWMKTTYDVIDGKPQGSSGNIMLDWKGTDSLGGSNIFQVILHPTRGLWLFIIVDGDRIGMELTDSNINWTAGDIIYFSYAYNKAGINGGPNNWEVYIGTDEDLYLVGSQSSSVNAMDTTSTKFTLLSNIAKSVSFKGGLDNVKFITTVTRKTIDEMNNTRNIETFEEELGYVFDNENLFYPGPEVQVVPELQLIIESLAPLDWAVPFYWALAITWSNDSITERTTLIRLPRIVINSSEAIILYLSTDMSNYFDEKLFRLGATDNV